MKRTRVIPCIAALVLAGALYFFNLPLGPNPNRFEIAQSQIILVESGENCGTGTVVTRTNPYGNPRIFLWTAAHVIGSEPFEITAKKIFRFEGSKAGTASFTARVIGVDSDLDIALLWVDAPPTLGITGVEFAGSSPLRVGTPIFHAGNFLCATFDGSVSTGVISQIGVQPDYPPAVWPWALLDQTDCTVLPGSSGGPVFTHDGKVVGILVARKIPTVNCFVPNRVVSRWARANFLEWALYGDACPTDAELEARIK